MKKFASKPIDKIFISGKCQQKKNENSKLQRNF